VDRAIAFKPAIDAYTRQAMLERSPLEQTRAGLLALAGPGAFS
jgi:hypothetical protein